MCVYIYHSQDIKRSKVEQALQIRDTNGIENVSGKNENFKLGCCVYDIRASDVKTLNCAYENFIYYSIKQLISRFSTTKYS